jgi:hypothetical protein
MNDQEPTPTPETPPAGPDSSATAASPPPPVSPPDGPAPMAAAELPPRSKVRRWFSIRRNKRIGWISALAMIGVVIGLTVSLTTSSSATAGHVASTSTSAAPPAAGASGGPRGAMGSGGGGSNARSGPAAGGAVGTVSSVSTTSFALSTPAGQKVTVNEASSTTYLNGTSSTSSSAITTGESVLVLGTVNSTTIAATQVTVQPAGGSATSSSAAVVPFQQGAPSTSKTVGQIPANYTEGSGTIVSGTTANQATEAALAAYPGGVVDRVVQLSNGEYEVHNIGVNWPHHVFVSQSFTVLGAD